MSELLPCPFCGGEAEIVGGPENWTPTFYDPDSGGDPIAVVCKTCACGLHFFDGYAEAAAAWNRRTDAVPVVRCGDCIYYDANYCKCNLHSEEPDQYSTGINVEMDSNDYCSYGERKESEGST